MAAKSVPSALPGLGFVLRHRVIVGEPGPIEPKRDVASLPSAAADPFPRFHKPELVGPGGEPARAAELAKLVQGRDQSVIGTPIREVVAIVFTQA